MTNQERVFPLEKDQTFSLTKDLDTVEVGLGWKSRLTNGAEFDLDASAIPLGRNNKYYGGEWFVYFKNLSSPGGFIESAGDDLTGGSGADDQDDETIIIQLSKLPADMISIVLPVSIYDAERRNQTFGQVGKAHCRILDQRNKQELVRYDLVEEFSTETAIVFAELYRDNRGGWTFRATGRGFMGNLRGVCRNYGVPVG